MRAEQRGVCALDVRGGIAYLRALSLLAVLALRHELHLGELVQIYLSVRALRHVRHADIRHDVVRAGNAGLFCGCLLLAEKKCLVALLETANDDINVAAVLCYIILDLYAVAVLRSGLRLRRVLCAVKFVCERMRVSVVCGRSLRIRELLPHSQPLYVYARSSH